MGRAAVFLLVLAGLALAAFQFVNRQRAPERTVMEHGAGLVAANELSSAGDQLYLTYRWAQTYSGPDLRNFPDLQLYRADDDGFCIQVVKEGDVFRLVGPGGSPEPGHC